MTQPTVAQMVEFLAGNIESLENNLVRGTNVLPSVADYLRMQKSIRDHLAATEANTQKLTDALELMWERYEDSPCCYEGGDEDSGSYAGHAVKLSEEEQQAILSLIPKYPTGADKRVVNPNTLPLDLVPKGWRLESIHFYKSSSGEDKYVCDLIERGMGEASAHSNAHPSPRAAVMAAIEKAKS